VPCYVSFRKQTVAENGKCSESALESASENAGEAPRPATFAIAVGKTHVGGIDINRLRTRGALAAVLALASSPAGFTVADVASNVRAMTGQPPIPSVRRHTI
jgi:hypothetical protein